MNTKIALAAALAALALAGCAKKQPAIEDAKQEAAAAVDAAGQAADAAAAAAAAAGEAAVDAGAAAVDATAAAGEAAVDAAADAAAGAVDDWQRLWTPPALQASDLLHPRAVSARNEIPMAATFPGLAPVPFAAAGDARGPLDDTAFSILLREARHRDEVGELLLRRVAAVLERSYLLAVHAGKIVGWLARGPGVVLDDVQSFFVGADEPSALTTIAGGDSFCGRLPDGVINQLLIEMLGDPTPVEVVIMPIVIRGRIVAYLVGDVPDGTASHGDLEDLLTAAKKAGVALEILVMKKKFLTPLP